MTSSAHGFRAMGAACSITVFAQQNAEELVGLGVHRVELLEQSWSRFRENSELNRLNARAGQGAVQVSADLLALLWHMRRAWEISDGLFDPTLLAEIRAAGYDADFATVIARSALEDVRSWSAPHRSSGMQDVEMDLEASTVSLPSAVGLDPGAIGKGLAADIVVSELLAAGATGVLVDLGGDIVAGGRPGSEEAWVIAIEDERDPENSDRDPMLVRFPAGEIAAIATSSTLYRRWAGGTRHHVLDPRTGQIADPELVQATVWCAAGWLAEISATAALLMKADQARLWLDRHELGYALMTSTTVSSSLLGAERV